MYHGGCYCGAIRFSVTRVFDCVYCHCDECRKTSGGPAVVTTVVPAADFVLLRGSPAAYRRSNGAHHFCGTCGSPIFYRPDDGPYLSIPVGVYDTPAALQPLAHQFWPQRLAWLALDDDLPKFDDNTLTHPDNRQR